MDQRGRYIKSSARIDWEGTPDSFALSYPYILAFEPDFIEVRHVQTVSEKDERLKAKSLNYSFSTLILYVKKKG